MYVLPVFCSCITGAVFGRSRARGCLFRRDPEAFIAFKVSRKLALVRWTTVKDGLALWSM